MQNNYKLKCKIIDDKVSLKIVILIQNLSRFFFSYFYTVCKIQ